MQHRTAHRLRSRLVAAPLILAWSVVPAAAVAANDAVFVSQTVPATVVRGASLLVELTFRNTGDTTWTLATGYFLGSENPMDNSTWGTNRVWLAAADTVAPGASFTFRATLTAPAVAGTYDFQWRMLQDAVEWFGATSTNLRIAVTAPVFVCDGTETVCLDLTSAAAVAAAGGTVVGGDFTTAGFLPADGGGLDWEFGPEHDFSAGELEVTVTGLVPVAGGELEGGKVSIFDFCGREPENNEGVGLQKMDEAYRDGHIFRMGMDDDGLADNWDAAIITGRDFGCYYSINDPLWLPGETHRFRAAWSTAGVELWIDDDLHCVGGGNGDTFDPASKVFTLAARCTHYANQQAVARFSDFRLWARGTRRCGNGMVDPGETCDGDCPAACDDGDPCTVDTLSGTAAACNAACTTAPTTACTPGDGCCPAGCGSPADSDCSATCGNGRRDPGETCDGDCPTTCDDGNACTTDTLVGSAAGCSAECTVAPIAVCAGGDGCCPAGCTPATDPDCAATPCDAGGDCADAVVEDGDGCDCAVSGGRSPGAAAWLALLALAVLRRRRRQSASGSKHSPSRRPRS
jgi:MYXO-CTERM domain-containing protein